MSMYGELTPLLGAALRFTATITDVNGNPVNPDSVAIAFRCQGQPLVGPFTLTFPPGTDPSGNVVYTGTIGSFICDYTLPNSGVWTYNWTCQPGSGADTTATSAIIEGEITISQPVA